MRNRAKSFSSWGKIPSLPFVLLLELSGRLRNGENQASVLAWLNTAPFVIHRMKARFNGAAISAENLSSWFKQDHQSYLRHFEEFAQVPGPTAKHLAHSETYRKGKIARLPHQMRLEVNRRLLDGQPMAKIVAWLNAEPCVIDRMKMYFDGTLIEEGSVSQWRLGGYQEWLNQRELLALTDNG
ncbi:MAG TPA: hypothetical protein VGM64_13305 [Lacunisphaera sp.]|jgi:hypothetical protein